MIGKVIVYEPPEGGIAVFRPSPQWLATVRAADRATASGVVAEILDLYHRRSGKDLTDDEILGFCMARVRARGRAVQVLDETELPERDEYRNAWRRRVDGRSQMKVEVDMEGARGIHMNLIREVRDAELKRLDVPFMRAVETGDAAAVAAIGKQKQALRDLPANFDLSSAETVTELRALWPTDLPKDP